MAKFMEPRTLLFVLDRGFVVVGRAELDPDLAFHWLLKPGRTVRRWGTTKGLAELKDGPLTNTVLDDPVTRHVPFRSVIEIIEVGEKAWRRALTGG
jgi:hypothetical protein